jgi:hypothetical protein
MIDRLLERYCAPLLGRFAVSLSGRGQWLSLSALIISLVGAALISRHLVWIGLGVFALSLGLAAVAARQPQPLDFLFAAVRFAALPFAFALDSPERAVSLIFLLFAMTVEAVARTRLGPGVLGAGEWFLIFVLLAVFPGGLVAYGAGVLCFVSVGVASRRIA